MGVDESLVKADVEGAFTDRGADEPVPAVAATRLLEIYNKTFAPARGLPQLSGTMLVGFRFPIDWNRSFVAQGKGGQQSGTAEVVGVSERGLLAGITIPLAAAQRLNAQFNEDNTVFSGVTLEAESPAQVPALLKAVEAMGLRVDDRERQLAESAGAAVTLTTAAMGLLSALICLLAAFNIAHALSAATRAREKELGVMRAVGARRVDLFKLVLAEALLLGALGGAAGALAAFGLAHGLDAVSAKMLPDFPFKPDSFFLFPAALIPSGVLGGALAALAGAWWPARRASRVDPSRVLSGQG